MKICWGVGVDDLLISALLWFEIVVLMLLMQL